MRLRSLSPAPGFHRTLLSGCLASYTAAFTLRLARTALLICAHRSAGRTSGEGILGGPGHGGKRENAVVDGETRHVHSDRRIEGTDLRVTAGGVAPVRGEADKPQPSDDDSRTQAAVADAMAAASSRSAAPSAAAAADCVANLTKGKILLPLLLFILYTGV